MVGACQLRIDKKSGQPYTGVLRGLGSFLCANVRGRLSIHPTEWKGPSRKSVYTTLDIRGIVIRLAGDRADARPQGNHNIWWRCIEIHSYEYAAHEVRLMCRTRERNPGGRPKGLEPATFSSATIRRLLLPSVAVGCRISLSKPISLLRVTRCFWV
jgi:hypothetical protein